MLWSQSLLYPLVVLFTIGGLIGVNLPHSTPLLLPFFGVYCLFTLGIHLGLKGKSLLKSSLLYIGFFCLGIVHFRSYYTLPKTHYSKLTPHDKGALKNILIEKKLSSTAYVYRYIGRMTQFGNTTASGNLIIEQSISENTQPLKLGQYFFTSKPLQSIRPPANPGAFSYKNYLSNQKIFHRLSLSTHDYVTKPHPNRKWKYRLEYLKESIINKVLNASLSDESKGMLIALLLAERSYLEESLITSYEQAGSIHLLALSGLHIGLFTAILMVLFRPLTQLPYGKQIRLIIIIGFLWLFAFFVGFSASVVRSVSLFSSIVIGSQISYGKNTFHYTVVSFFILLLLHPPYLQQVGFQFSYLAVFGILSIQPQIEQFWQPKPMILKRIWQWSTLCIAAQLAVSPASVYYFHQFPGLFLITNLILLPAFGLFLGFCLLVFFMILTNMLPQFLSGFFDQWVQLINSIVRKIAGQEAFLFEGLYPSLTTTLLFYLLLMSLLYFLAHISFKRMVMVFLCSIAFVFHLHHEQKVALNENAFWILHRHQTTFLGHLNHGNWKFFTSNRSKTEGINLDFTGSHRVVEQSEMGVKNVYIHNNFRLLIIDSNSLLALPNFNPSHILLLNDPKINADRLLNLYHPIMVISDGSNSPWNTHRWKRSCAEKNVAFYDTRTAGALRINLENGE